MLKLNGKVKTIHLQKRKGNKIMKKAIIAIVLLLIIIGLVVFFVTRNQKPAEPVNVEPVEETVEEVVDVPKEEEIGTAGSNIPLKDNLDEAEYQIQVAFQNYLAEAYGEKVNDARIYVEKIYLAEEEQEIDALKEMNLGPNEVAFEVRYELHPAEGVDVNEFTAANGVYNEESGWITEKYNLGVLRPNPTGEAPYVVTNLGTGW